MRQGFAALGAKSGKLWEDQARRMVDAQAPGVARRLRQIDEMTFAGEGWHSGLLDRLARLHLLAEGFRRRDELPPEVAEDVRAAIGFPNDLEAVRAGAGVRDHWQVIGQTVAVEDRLTVLRTWLIGRDTHRPALVLDFAAGGKPLEPSLPPGVVLDAELAFFPGSAPLRALVKQRHDVAGAPGSPFGRIDDRRGVRGLWISPGEEPLDGAVSDHPGRMSCSRKTTGRGRRATPWERSSRWRRDSAGGGICWLSKAADR